MRILALLLTLLAVPALAQEAPVATAPPVSATPPSLAQPEQPYVPPAIDPLGDLISQSGPATTDEEEAIAPSAPPPHHKPTLLPPSTPEPRAPTATLDGLAAPQGTYVPAEQAYEMRVKGSIVAAQGLQGPLDGGWKISDTGGAILYSLQIVDPAGGNGPVEGAWRDVRRPGAVGSTGLIESVEQAGERLVVRFNAMGEASVLTLQPTGTTRWSGALYESGASRPVVAEREAPPSLPPGYVIQGRGPVIWGAPRAAAPRPAPARPVTCSTRGKTGKALKAAKARCAALAKKSGASAKAPAKGSRAKATAPRKGKAPAKKAPARKKPNLR